MNDVGATTLKDRIAEFTSNISKHAPPQVLATLAEELRKLGESGLAAKALHAGAKAPEFSLPDAQGKIVTLSSILAKGPAVVTFYRGGWCPFCDLQLRAYEGVLPEIRRLGAELIAISPQTLDYVLTDVEKKQLEFPVVSDLHNVVARQYGLVFALSEALQGLQKSFGNPVPKFNGDESWELPIPGTFVLDHSGVVRLAHVDPDYTKRLEPSAILESLRAARS